MTILHRSCMGWNGAMSKARAVAKRTRKDTRVAWLEPFEELDLPDFPGLGLLTGGGE